MKSMNRMFIALILILLLIVIFIDNDSLNSLMIKEEELDINEVAVANIDYNKVVYKETQPQNTNNTPTNNQAQVSPVAQTDYWVWPTEKEYTITTYFSGGHNAIDICSYQGYGSKIFAANNGTVTMVKGGCTPGYLSCNGNGGNYIVINHNNNYYTVYMHLKDINVKVGDTVSRGQQIGTMGNTGNVIPTPTVSNPTGGTHLHFSLYVGEPFRGGYAINPLRLY